jgi:hypothetical protein
MWRASASPHRFVTDWLAHEAKSRAFIAAEQKRPQGDLFSCAERSPSITPRKLAPGT